jgi:putative flippase GtrA
MYSDEELYSAVDEGIFKKEDVDAFRLFVAKGAKTNSVDEENFRLVSGFNDIFVSIAALVLLISAGWIAEQIAPVFGFLVAALISWLLSEFFVFRKKLALPAIILLVSFVVNCAIFTGLFLSALGVPDEFDKIAALAVGALAAWIHWLKFKVPVTVAAGMGSLVACILVFVELKETSSYLFNVVMLAFGLLTFFFAMRWDCQDPQRITRKSDVAFWLHLLSAPLVVHPTFAVFGLFDGNATMLGITLIIFTYILLATLSVAIDRRAMMVSSLVYVLFAFKEVFYSLGLISSGLAISGVLIGSLLLLLSTHWQKSRFKLLQCLPGSVTKRLPPAL